MAVASNDEGLLVALAGAPGIVLYCLEKSETEPGPSAWRIDQRARLCPLWTACAVCLSADGSALAAAALGSQLHVWDLEPGLHAIRLELQVLAPEMLQASSLCGAHAYTAAVLSFSSCTILVCAITTGEVTVSSHTSALHGARLHSSMRLLRCD